MVAPIITAAALTYFSQLSDIVESNEELKKTSRGILSQVLKCALCIVVGGLLLGPFGAMIGGIIGSVYAYVTSGSYSSAFTIMRRMTDDEKAQVVQNVKQLVGSDAISDLRRFLTASGSAQLLLSAIQAASSGQSYEPPKNS